MRRTAIAGASSGAGRIEHHRLAGEARARAQQPIELPAGLEFLEPSERRDHPLAHLIAGAVAFDDLQVDAPGRGLAAEIHARLPCWCAQSRDSDAKIQGQIIIDVALHFRATHPPNADFMRVSEPPSRAKC